MGFGKCHPCVILLSILNTCEIFKTRQAGSERDGGLRMIPSPLLLLFGSGNPSGGSVVKNAFTQISWDLRASRADKEQSGWGGGNDAGGDVRHGGEGMAVER